jgi:hypothetical protein
MEERYVRFGILKGGEEKSFANFKKVKVLYIYGPCWPAPKREKS